MLTAALPPRRQLLRAFQTRDRSYDGIFVTAVRTTKIFCRPTCPARRPRPEHVEFFASCGDAVLAGYRPCRRCRPMAAPGEAPPWLTPLLAAVERDPARRWRDADLRAMDLEPARVSRWFKSHHGMTFHAYSRARRLGTALGGMQRGRKVADAAFDVGWNSLSGFNAAFQRFAGAAPGSRRDAPVVHVRRIGTPLGPMVAAATTDHLVLLEFADRRMVPTQFAAVRRRLRCVFAPGGTAVVDRLEAQLAEYFAGRRRAFDVPIRVPGTPFQERVWSALGTIPTGETRSYAAMARAIGRPSAVRAVAKANGDNRIAILIPCHRVVGSDGNLTGYGGGLWRKRRLLELEAAAGAATPGGGARPST